MTYTQPNTDIDLSIIPGEDVTGMAKKMQAAGQIQVARDIARLKAMGEPIYEIAPAKPASAALAAGRQAITYGRLRQRSSKRVYSARS